jgi:hypothetical protein
VEVLPDKPADLDSCTAFSGRVCTEFDECVLVVQDTAHAVSCVLNNSNNKKILQRKKKKRKGEQRICGEFATSLLVFSFSLIISFQ